MEILLPTKPQYHNISKEDKIEQTEASFREYNELDEKMVEISNAFDDVIRDLLTLPSEEAANAILDVATSQKYSEGLQHRQYRYQHFVKFANTLLYEKQYGRGYSISSFHSIEDINDIYQQLVLYLRRIEFDFEIRDQLEIFIYIAQNRLSYFHLLASVEHGTIYHKSKVYKKLAEYIGLQGEENWKQFFIEWDRVHESE